MTTQDLIPLQVIDAHRHGVWALGLLLDGHIISGGGDGLLKVWELATQTGKLALVSQIPTPHTEVLIVRRTQRGRLVSAGHHGGIAIWDMDLRRDHLSLRQHLGIETDYWEFNDRILETRPGHLITWAYLTATPPVVWEWSTAQGVFQFKQELPLKWASALLEDAQGHLLSGDRDGKINIWQMNIASGSWTATKMLQAHNCAIRALCWTREDNLISAGGDDALIKVWQQDPDNEFFVLQQVLQGHMSPITDIMETEAGEIISNDQGTRFLIVRWRHKPEFWVWRKQPQGFQPVQHETGLVRKYLDHSLIVDDIGESLSLWKKEGEVYERRVTMINGHRDLVVAVELLPGGRLITGGLDGRLILWDLEPFLLKS